MFFKILPLQTILLQFLFLLIAIALEAIIIHHQLKLSRKTSIDYAASINLFATIFGWLAFFFILPLLGCKPDLPCNPYFTYLKGQILSYIFFDRFLSSPSTSFNFELIGIGLIIFFAAFFIKLTGLEFIQFLLQTPLQDNQHSVMPRNTRRRTRLTGTKVNQDFLSTKSRQAAAILLGNACSHTAILLILLLRTLQVNSISN